MTRAHRVLCGLLFFFGGVQPAFAQALGAKDQSSDACPGTLASVRQACGCEPREEAVFNVLAQTKLGSDNLRSRVMGCFKLDGTLNVDALKKLNGDAALSGCLSKMEDQYPEYRQTLATLVMAAKDVAPRKLDIWLGCYAKTLNPPKSSRAAASRPSTPAPAPAARQAGSSPSAAGAPATAPSPDIEQRVEAEGSGSVTTEGVEAVHDGKSGSSTIRQVIKASDKGVVKTGPIKAHVGP
ncbi:MAG TPA: hypothetical protein VEU33_33210 [Archangium sp.]|nr:hypothetical protein [Archangium sp.]